jgi:TolA-binding protein
MPAYGWRVAVFTVVFLGLAQGCRAVPPIPESVRARGYKNEVSEDGWLFRDLTGKERPADGVSSSTASSGVTQASAEEPAAPSAESTKPLIEAVAPPGKGYVVDEVEKEEKGFELSDLAPDKVYKRMKSWAGYGPNEGVARALYDEGQDLYKQKKYDEAAKKFASAADRWPDSTLEEDALFMLGESYFFADRYPKANDAYGRLLKKYEYSHHLDTTVTRLFAIGRYWEQMAASDSSFSSPVNMSDKSRPWIDTFGYGIKAYETVRLHDPTGPLADDSIMAAANAYFVRNRFEDAAYHYDLIRKEYPKSEHQIKAHVLGMKSRIKTYQGPMYEGKPLEDAKEISEQSLKQFGKELGDERKFVLDTRNRVTEELAARDLAIAQYYDKKAYYGSARYYYQTVIDEHPQTAVAQMARKRLEEIKDLPAEPTNHFKWLTDTFSAKK